MGRGRLIGARNARVSPNEPRASSSSLCSEHAANYLDPIATIIRILTFGRPLKGTRAFIDHQAFPSNTPRFSLPCAIKPVSPARWEYSYESFAQS